MGTKKNEPGSEDFGIVDTGIERFPRLPAVPPSVAGTSSAAGAWGGGGDDGPDLRAGVGTSVGIGVGTSVGIGVGTSVGIGVGTSVGIGVGTSVGIGVGTSVGIGTGTSVGIGVGTSVGIGGSSGFAGSGAGEGAFALDTSAAGANLRHALLLARQVELLSSEASHKADLEGDRVTARDLWKVVRIAQLAISPCGEWVAFVKLQRPSGGAVLHEQIYLKRVGSEPGKDEFPLTGNTVLADSPVWKPKVFGQKSTEAERESDSRKTEILFRARATSVDVLQLYVIEVELPAEEDPDKDPKTPLRVGRVRRLTNAPVHPWAPKWRRFKDEKDIEQNRVYYVTTTLESTPAGYDHLVYDDALVGWWDNLRLPHDKWRFYELDPYAADAPRDLLGTHQPMLDFVYGVWNCWDVHPGGEEIVWTEVKQIPNSAQADPTSLWPNDVEMEIFSMKLERRGVSNPQPAICLTSNIVGSKDRGRYDDYMPMYSPDGTYIIYAEKQFSALPADYPRLVRLNRTVLKKQQPDENQTASVNQPKFEDGVDVFDVIKNEKDKDFVLPIAWKFLGSDKLVVLIEDLGKHKLRQLTIPKQKILNGEAGTLEPLENDYKSSGELYSLCGESLGAQDSLQDAGSTQDFDVLLNPRGELVTCAVVSGINTPPELCSYPPSNYNSSKRSKTQFNSHLDAKSGTIAVSPLKVSRDTAKKADKNNVSVGETNGAHLSVTRPYGRFYEKSVATVFEDSIGGWLVYPSKLEQMIQPHEYPLIQLLHGGPHSAWIDEFHMRFNASLLASQGYVVAMVNFRGSTGTPEGEPEILSQFLKELRNKKPEEVRDFVKTELEDEKKKGIFPEVIKDLEKHYIFAGAILMRIAKDGGKDLYHQVMAAILGDNWRDTTDFSGWGEAIEDVDRVTRHLLQNGFTPRTGAKGKIDPDRIAVIGGSYGAYLGARLLGWKGTRTYQHPDTGTNTNYAYKAYVLHAGVYDPLSHFASDAFWVQDDNFGIRPWVRGRIHEDLYSGNPDYDGDPRHWEEFSHNSPLLRSQGIAGDVKKPAVLITHGLSDLRVHWQQSVLLHRMLLDRGARSRLALYPGLGHRLDQPEPSVQWWTAALSWLEDNGVPAGRR